MIKLNEAIKVRAAIGKVNEFKKHSFIIRFISTEYYQCFHQSLS